jgi:ketosteroid isomerase-like protein
MSLESERAAFRAAHAAWANSDLEGFLNLVSDDLTYSVNVDGLEVPYAASAEGKPAVRARLRLLLDTFVINAFIVEQLVHEAAFSRSTVLGYYRHKATGERLTIRLRFRGWVRDGLVLRLEEHHDAAYIEAFQRFVTHLQAAANATEE